MLERDDGDDGGDGGDDGDSGDMVVSDEDEDSAEGATW